MMIRDIANLISKGFNRNSLHLIIEKRYDLKSYNARNKYIKLASAKINEELDIESLKTLLISRLDALSEKAEKNKKYGEAIKAIDTQAKLLGILEVNKSISVKTEDTTFTVKFGND